MGYNNSKGRIAQDPWSAAPQQQQTPFTMAAPQQDSSMTAVSADTNGGDVSLPTIAELLQKSCPNGFTADDQPGKQVSGTITKMDVVQSRNITTKQPEYWDSGQPKLLMCFTLQTAEHEDEDDDGLRAVWVKTWGVQMTNLREGLAQAGLQTPSIGDTMTATFTGLGTRDMPGHNPPKIYQYKFDRQ